MKRLSLIFTATLLLGTVACNPEGVDELGDLYGRWKLESVDSPTPIQYCDTMFLAFQDQVYQYQPHWQYDWGIFKKTTDSLILYPVQFMRFRFQELGITVNHPKDCAPFKIDQLENKRMQLSRHDTIWYFRKYIK